MSEVRVNKGRDGGSEMTRKEGASSPAQYSTRWPLMGPFGFMRHFNEIDRAFRNWNSGGTEGEAWPPTVDVRQCGGSLVIAAELPGLKREDVKVELTDNTLVIEGEKKREHKEDHEGYHRWESSYGHFYRAVPLPEGAKTDQAKAELTDGVLKVSIPVPEAKQNSRQVPIEEGSKLTPASK